MGDNYREVDLTANALINVGAIHESPALNSSTYSINSTNLTTKTLYTFQSDTIGNITNVGGVVNLDWNGRRLESISQGGTVVASYDYNIDGQRISKTVNGVITEYFYNGDILAGQKTGDDVLIFMYDNNGDIFGFTYNGTPYYYVKNAQNDVFLILDENGQAVVLYFYDAWGRVVSGFDGTDFGLIAINPIMYRSYYVDLEMGMFMYYLNSRYYVADWGRFVSADSVAGVNQDMLAYNIFAYCSNDPVNCIDTTGQGKIWNWVKEQYNKLKDWLNDTPTYSGPEIPTGNDVVSDILGTLSEAFEQNVDNAVNGWKPPNSPRKTTNGATVTNVSLSVIGTGFDIANTWTAQNSNTNLKRIQKTGIQITACAVEIGIGVYSGKAAAAITVLTKGRGLAVGTAAGIAMQQGGCYVVGLMVDWAYDALEIE